ncbi:MAG: TonB-dependent receptor [Sphingomonadales bacterium]|nr:MAG: TonB-dependent receptor [Sphingomonadales bacterium]TNF03403.1 MAG: TonB-dependent receptor [Sphingomonadales bacterium]
MSICRESRKKGAACLLATTAIITSLLAPESALAQAADTPAEATTGLGEIVVTATRTAESVQKVPISMQALGEAKMEQRQIKGMSDFANLLPSVSFAGLGPGRQEPYFRGIVPAGGSYDATGYYIDDMPISTLSAGITSGFPDIHVYDIERVEALAGPQGTLYGAGSLAGTVRFITKKPVFNKFEFGYDLEGNKYGKGDFGGQAQAYINIPVSDSFAVRAMGYYQRDGGYIDNVPGTLTYNLGDDNPLTSYTINNDKFVKKDYNPVYSYGGRIQALWEVAPGWEINPQLTAQEQIAYGYFNYDASTEITDDHQNIGGDLIVHDYEETRQLDRWYQAALAVHGHIGDFDLVSSTGYYQRRIKLINDYTYYTVAYDQFAGYENYLQFFDQNGNVINPTQYTRGNSYQDKFNQEIRLSTPKSWPFDVTIGGFYQWQKTKLNNDYATHGLDQISGYTAAGSYSEGGNTTSLDGFGIPQSEGGTMITLPAALRREAFYLSESDRTTKDWAVFAEGHYEIVPNLTLTAGIRYFWTESAVIGWGGIAGKARNSSAAWYFPTESVGCPVPFTGPRLSCVSTNPLADDKTNRYSENGETHKLALTWQFEPSKMVYFNYSTGFRPGGSNSPVSIRSVATPAPSYKAETLSNFELGVKTTWNNMFRFNAAVYYEKWKDIQYGVQVVGAAGGGFTGNAGNARVYGVEYDAELRLGKFTIATSGAYTDAALDGNFCAYEIVGESGFAQIQNCTGDDIAAKSGTRLPRQPKFKGNSSVRYETDLINGLSGHIQGVAYYQSGATQDLNETYANLLGDTKGFASFDFSFGLKKNNWTAEMFIQNAFDKRGWLTKNTFCQIQVCEHSSRVYPIKPQFMGIRFGQKF